MSKKENIRGTESTHSESHDRGSHRSDHQDTESLHTEVPHTEVHDSRGSSGVAYQEGYQFAISSGGIVTSVAEVEHGVTRIKTMKPGETYSVSGTDVLKTENKAGFQEITRYTDSNGDGLYQKTTETTLLNADTTTTPVQLAHDDHMKFGLDSSGQDVLSTSHALGSDGASDETLDAHAQFSVQDDSAVEAGTTHWEVTRDVSADGVYPEVAHGNDLHVDLVGLATSPAEMDYSF